LQEETLNGAKKVRTFIALEISDEAREELARIEDKLKEAEADVKWIKPESIHLTLKFLGYITEEKVPSIAKRLKDITSGTLPFNVVLSEIGVFPKWRYARVLWIGVEEGKEKVKTLAGMIEEAMEEEGFEKEKREFKSHITIGRIRTSKKLEKLEKEAGKIKVNPAVSNITKVVLFKSDLTPKGAIYTPLAVADFGSSK
jgi:2'-5' RNA ligase